MRTDARPTAALKAQATALGFDVCGVAAADAYPELAFLREWLARGFAGDMGWLERSAEKRTNPQAVLPGACSVVVTGTVYNTDQPYSGTLPPDVARVSRYAWGDDYHDVLKTRMRRLVDWMRTEWTDPFEALAYVDTGPVQERVFAQYAGLGWVGKNTCLINAELGSWLFLAVIVTTLPLEPDTEGLEQCGSCTRCLEACPTGALVEPGVLDATQCLSYLTIEHRSAIPDALRPALGAHVYGCDICQEVCPYNSVPSVTPDPAWQARSGLAQPRLIDLWRRSDTELRRLIKGSPMTRPKLTGLRRNLAVAIGNSGDPEAVAALDDGQGTGADRASVADPLVQAHVAWARGRQP